MSLETRENYEQKLNFWKHVSKSISSFDHQVFVKSNELNSENKLSNTSNSKNKATHTCNSGEKYSLYKYQDKTYPVCNLKYLELRHGSVDWSCSKCSSKLCDNKASLQTEPILCKNCKLFLDYKNQALFIKFKIKPLTVVLSDCKTIKTELESKNFHNSYSNLVHPTEIKSEPKISKIKKNDLCVDLKPSNGFFNNLVKEDSFGSNEPEHSLTELQVLASKTPIKKPTIKLHRIEQTVAYCLNLNLQPAWKSTGRRNHKSIVKVKKYSRFRSNK